MSRIIFLTIYFNTIGNLGRVIKTRLAQMSQFNAPHFQTPEAARAYLEALRWTGGKANLENNIPQSALISPHPV